MAETASQPSAPLLDVHVHAVGAGDSDSGIWVSPRYRRSPVWLFAKWQLGLLGCDGRIDRTYAEKLAAAVRESPLDAAVVQGFDGFYDARGELDRRRTDFLVPNEHVARLAAEFPEILPAASVNPLRRDWAEELAKCAELRCLYVKINPCAMGFDPGEERLRPFYRRMAELRLPLMCHIGPERALTSFGHRLADPAGLGPALEEGLVVIAAHAGTSAAVVDRHPYFENLVRMMERHERLYADSSAVAQPPRWHWMRRIAGNELVRSRLLHGSDYPLPPIALPWGGMSWRKCRALPRGNNIARDFAIKEAFGIGREAAARAGAVLMPAAGPAPTG